MAVALHFGAGKIGKGFIGDLLHQSGYDIVFADVVQPAVDEINRDGEYSLFLIDHEYQEQVIDRVSALSTITQAEEVMDVIAKAKVITTSVMAVNLPKIAPILAKGLKKRLSEGREKAIVMACENAIMGTDILKKAMIDTGIITEAELDAAGVYPNTAVDRMVFGGVHNGKEGIDVGDAYELAVEKGKLPDSDSEPVTGAEYVDDLGKYLRRKIYMINCGHAICSYLGYVYGYTIVQDALRDPEIQSQVVAAVLESAAALEKEYGFDHDDLVDYMNKMILRRFTTPGISDPISRVAREPIRKISPDDRLMGPAYQCEKNGLENRHLLRGIACALRYVNPEDEQAAELQEYIGKNGIEAAITAYTNAQPGSHIFNVILEEYKKLEDVKPDRNSRD